MKKLHWRSHVHDAFVPLLGLSGELAVAVGGGADYGEFPFVTSAPSGVLTVGDIILEIGGTPVLGMTLGDVRGVLNSCPQPIRIKTVSPGNDQHRKAYRFSPGNNVNVHSQLPHRLTTRPLLFQFCLVHPEVYNAFQGRRSRDYAFLKPGPLAAY